MERVHGKFLEVVDQIQMFMESDKSGFQFLPYSAVEERAFLANHPGEKYLGYEIDETEGNVVGNEAFGGFITLYLIINDGENRRRESLTIPSLETYPAESPDNVYEYDIDLDNLGLMIFALHYAKRENIFDIR